MTEARLEVAIKLEELIKKHITLYPNRHLDNVSSTYELNKRCIERLATRYIEMFNELPSIKISALNDYYKEVADINQSLYKKYAEV